jgi:carbonic anhydrase/acetyltransferase-like protein (isoleucine patch superfamily)
MSDVSALLDSLETTALPTDLNDSLFVGSAAAKRKKKEQKKRHRFRYGAVADAHRHPNGGGWVANDATVGDEVYVGPSAEVSGNSVLRGRIEIKSKCCVHHSLIMLPNNAACTLSGRVNVLNSTVTGNMILKGDLDISYTNISGTTKIEGYVQVRSSTIENATIVGEGFVGNESTILNSVLRGTFAVDNHSNIVHSTIIGMCAIYGGNLLGVNADISRYEWVRGDTNMYAWSRGGKVRKGLIDPAHVLDWEPPSETAIRLKDDVVYQFEINAGLTAPDSGQVERREVATNEPALVNSILGFSCGLHVRRGAVLRRVDIRNPCFFSERTLVDNVGFPQLRNPLNEDRHDTSSGNLRTILAAVYNALIPSNETYGFAKSMRHIQNLGVPWKNVGAYREYLRSVGDDNTLQTKSMERFLPCLTKNIRNMTNDQLRSWMIDRLCEIIANGYAYYLPDGACIHGRGRRAGNLRELHNIIVSDNAAEPSRGGGRPATQRRQAQQQELFDPRGTRLLRN